MNKNEQIKVIIVDDSPQARKLLRLMLKELAPEIYILAEADNVNSGISAILEHKPDAVFLDIEMPEKSGLQLADELIKQNINCEIIFTTAFNDYAINAFRLSAIDYLLKPINENQLLQAIEKLKEKKKSLTAIDRLKVLSENLNPVANDKLCIPIHNGYEYIPVNEIEYLEADGSYVHIFLFDKKQKTVSKNLKYFDQLLSKFSNFVRVHRSFCININCMSLYSKSGRGTITMKNGRIIDLARDRRAAFLEILENKNK